MLIDWFTVIAQIINFFILIALLKHFLYGRILHAMDERERAIAQRIEAAEQQDKQAARERESWHKKNKELDQARHRKLEQIKQEVRAERQQQEKQVREQIEQKRGQWSDALRSERESFLRGIREQTGSRIVDAIRLALESLAGARLEQQIIAVFTERLRSAGDDRDTEIAEALEAGPAEVTVRTSFDITDEARKELADVIRGHTGRETEVRHQTDRDMVAGIELCADGSKISWNIDSFMHGLAEALRSALQDEEKSPDNGNGAGRNEPDGARGP